MSALAHDARCETKNKHGIRPVNCLCAERALTDSRQREEEAKGHETWLIRKLQTLKDYTPPKDDRPAWQEIQGWIHVLCSRAHGYAWLVDEATKCSKDRDALRAENDRLTFAASESARTLQVRIAELEAGERHCDEYHGELADQVTALREALKWLESHPDPRARLALAAFPQDGA